MSEAAPRRVLVVDDEPDIRTLLERTMRIVNRAVPIEVRTAPDVAGAIAALEGQPFDLVLSDYRMGARDGVALLTEVRQRWPATTRLLMTGDNEDVVDDTMHAEAALHGVIRKPWDTPKLVALLTELLREPRGGA